MKTILRILIGVCLGLILVGGAWFILRAPQGRNITLYPPSLPATEFIQITVMGAVKHPGVYELEENSRVIDAVESAGGFVSETDQSELNLAAPLVNGQNLNIPFKAESTIGRAQNSVITTGRTPSATLTEKDKLLDTKTPIVVTSAVTNSCSNGATGSGTFVWPTDNHFLSGNDYGDGHPGIDIAAGEGAPVYAADSGVVTAMGNDESVYGNVIQLDHGNGYITVYAHLSVIGVSMCQSVDAGQRIGSAGNTGNSRGPHLHFEIIQDSWPIDPWLILPQK